MIGRLPDRKEFYQWSGTATPVALLRARSVQRPAKPAKVQRHRVPRQHPRLGRAWLRRIVLILFGIVVIQGINHQTVEEHNSIAAKLLFERAPNDAIIYGFAAAGRAISKREVAHMMGKVMLAARRTRH
jgi:hypothetical protein